VATTHGHYFPTANADKQVVAMDLVAGGPDPLAVDVVCAKLIGFGLGDVAHLALAAAKGLGQGDLAQITIVNRHLFDQRQKQLSCELLEDFPPNLKILRGQELCCKEGCRLNTESVVELLYRDHQGKGGFTIVMGKGFDPQTIDAIDGPVHLAGGCAIEECGVKLGERLAAKHRVTESPGCNDLALTVKGLCAQMKVNPISLARTDLVRSVGAFILAQFHRTRANIVPLV
jgi:hypothetical protein